MSSMAKTSLSSLSYKLTVQWTTYMEHRDSPMFPITPVLGIYTESIHNSTVSSDPFKCFLSKNVCIMDDKSFSNNQGQFPDLWHLLPQAH
jgi:hypothetical protein